MGHEDPLPRLESNTERKGVRGPGQRRPVGPQAGCRRFPARVQGRGEKAPEINSYVSMFQGRPQCSEIGVTERGCAQVYRGLLVSPLSREDGPVPSAAYEKVLWG